jgi:putative DNA primase/helicase
MLKPIFKNIPVEIKSNHQWVNFNKEMRNGKQTKPPYKPQGGYAKPDDPLPWSSFEACMRTADKFDGLGFVRSNDDPYVALDFDHCRCPAFDGVTSWANSLDMVLPGVAYHIRKLNTYTEKSPSATGISGFLKGKLPVDGKKEGNFEVYQARHYVTVTGHVLDGFPMTIENRQDALDEFYQAVFGTSENPREQEKKSSPSIATGDWKERLEKAFQSVNGSEIQHLWEGNITKYGNDHSAADMALCSHLAFWINSDKVAIDEAFRASGLYREK